MPDERHHTAALATMFLLCLALKLYFATQSPLIYNNDAGYYVEHINEVLSQGYPDVTEPPIPFYYAGFFALFLGVMMGFKVAICIASAAIAFPVYMIARHLGKDGRIALFAAFLAAFSPTNMLMMGDLLKNQVGLFFGAWFIYLLLKATDRFTVRDGALAAACAILMVGSHLSSSAYIMLAVAPFLVLRPAYGYWKEKRIGGESLFCIAMAALLFIAGLGVLAYRGMGISDGGIGPIGFYGGQGDISPLIDEYLLFIPFALLGLRTLGGKRLLLFLPWLLVTLMLSMPFFTQGGWEARFVWNAYFLVALLTALGVGYLSKDRVAFYGSAILLGVCALSGFLYFGDDIGPVIYQQEWEGMLALHSQRPDIGFSRAGGGMAQWLNAAGFSTTTADMPGNYLLLCDSSVPVPDRWLEGGCKMTVHVERRIIEQTDPIAHFGRFYVVPIEQVPKAIQEGQG